MGTIAPLNITVCGLDELAAHCETGASHVLSILDPDHPVPEAFGRFGEHEKLELRFHDVIEADRGMTAVGYRRARAKAFRIWRQETCVHHAR